MESKWESQAFRRTLMKSYREKGDGMLKIKRVYESAVPGDGVRFLVDRLWPRGIRKENLEMKAWLKETAPSPGLRRWY